jgi:signal transduction histidine kinase
MTNLATSIVDEAAGDTHGDSPLFERHPTPSLLFTRAGLIAHANAAARKFLHAQDASLAGRPLADILPVAAPLAGADEPRAHRRIAVRRLDGSTFMARVHIVPADTQSDALLLASIEDLSDLEREIESANKEFEALTSAAGHDLRGPLRILKGFAEALEDECGAVLSEDGRNFLREIVRAGDRMEGLVDGLLAFSRAGRTEMSRENLDLTTLIELVFYELRHGQGERIVECHAQPGMNAWGDVRLMMTVLRNLIGNAWKFTARNPAANVRCEVEQRDGQDWICVIDDGAGFDMTQAARLFQPFTRLHRQDEFAGHGMGLATAQRIIRRHGGEIEAISGVGKGTRVRFWLPPRPEV